MFSLAPAVLVPTVKLPEISALPAVLIDPVIASDPDIDILPVAVKTSLPFHVNGPVPALPNLADNSEPKVMYALLAFC